VSDRTWQDMPGWLQFEVRLHRARAVAAGLDETAEDAVAAIPGKVLADDPEFARLLVARFVRSLVRAAPAAGKRPATEKQEKKARERRRLAQECAALADGGMTLREIGRAKGISHQTAANLISEWLMSVDSTISRQDSPSKSATDLTADFDTNVVPLRRPA
jgi:hypothetical protein